MAATRPAHCCLALSPLAQIPELPTRRRHRQYGNLGESEGEISIFDQGRPVALWGLVGRSGPDGVGGAALSSVWEDKSLFVRGGLDMEKNQ